MLTGRLLPARRLLALVATLVCAGGLVVLSPAESASAAQAYAVTTTTNFRAGPGTTWGVTQTVASGSTIYVDCQVQGGTTVNGNATWDHMTNGQWVADGLTTTPSYNSYISGMPACSREWRALAWASAQVGAGGWDGWCEKFVENAYGTTGVYASALADHDAQAAAGRLNYSTPPPAGALVFFRNPYDGGYGHVELSRGDGTYVTTASTVRIVDFAWAGTFTGWSWAPTGWPGRW